jgi:uncharacterized membrane protein
MFCRNCGKEVSPSAETCPTCSVKPSSGKAYCPACGGQTSELAEYCTKCGTHLKSSSETSAGTSGTAPLPGVSSPYRHGWNILWPNFGWLLVAFIIYAVISGAGSSFSSIPFIGRVLSGVISIFVGIPLSFGLSWVFLKAVRKEKYEIIDVFAGFQGYWNAVGAGILTALIVIGGLILVIVPGIVFACKLAFVPYLVIDKKLGVTDAIQTSWRMTRGHAVEVFAIGLLGILLMIAGVICLGVGIIIAIMWIEAASASLYYAVSARETGNSQAAPIPASPSAPSA